MFSQSCVQERKERGYTQVKFELAPGNDVRVWHEIEIYQRGKYNMNMPLLKYLKYNMNLPLLEYVKYSMNLPLLKYLVESRL